MDFIDIVLGGLLGFACYKGLRNGLFIELASLVSFIVGVYVAVKFSYIVKGMMEKSVSWSPKTMQITSFIITIIIVVIVIHLSAKLFTKIADFAFLGWINKIAGAFLSMLKTTLMLGVLLSLFVKINIDNMLISEEKQESSLFFQPILKTSEFVLPVLKDWFEDLKSQSPV